MKNWWVYIIQCRNKSLYTGITTDVERRFDEHQKDNKKASNFEFQYLDMFGNIKHFGYRLDPNMEGRMLFFPARLQHTVYPFYNCDEARISVAGNLWYRGI